MDINLPEELMSKLHEMSAQLGLEPEALITLAVEKMTQMDSEGLMAMISGDHAETIENASSLLESAKSLFNR